MAYIITPEHLKAITGAKNPVPPPTQLMIQLAEWINKTCPAYGIDTPQEFAHFLAQACHETASFKTLREMGGDSYFTKYEKGVGPKDKNGKTLGDRLGNTFAGDGLKFKGRGIFQTTGRFNYKDLSLKKGGAGDMFIKNPALLEQPEFAVWSACEYWQKRGLNDISNHPDTDKLKKKVLDAKSKTYILIDVSPVEYISRSINGGIKGLPERMQFYANAKKVLV